MARPVAGSHGNRFRESVSGGRCLAVRSLGDARLPLSASSLLVFAGASACASDDGPRSTVIQHESSSFPLGIPSMLLRHGRKSDVVCANRASSSPHIVQHKEKSSSGMLCIIRVQVVNTLPVRNVVSYAGAAADSFCSLYQLVRAVGRISAAESLFSHPSATTGND